MQLETYGYLKEWEQVMLSKALAQKTIKNYLSWGSRMAAKWPVLDPETFPECVQIASASLRRQAYSATTIHNYQCAMAHLAASIWQWDPKQRKALITARPVKTSHNVPSTTEIATFVHTLHNPHRLVALLCYCCGLRISEAVTLTLGDCNLRSLSLSVRLTKCSKGRLIPIPPELVSELRKHYADALAICEQDLNTGGIVAPLAGYEWHRKPSSAVEPGQWPLFPQKTLIYDHRIKRQVRVALHTDRIEKAFKVARTESRVVTRITPHRLRDAFAVHSLIAGVPVNVVQKHLGHSSLETTAKYLSFLLSDEGAKLFPGINLMKKLNKSA